MKIYQLLLLELLGIDSNSLNIRFMKEKIVYCWYIRFRIYDGLMRTNTPISTEKIKWNIKPLFLSMTMWLFSYFKLFFMCTLKQVLISFLRIIRSLTRISKIEYISLSLAKVYSVCLAADLYSMFGTHKLVSKASIRAKQLLPADMHAYKILWWEKLTVLKLFIILRHLLRSK